MSENDNKKEIEGLDTDNVLNPDDFDANDDDKSLANHSKTDENVKTQEELDEEKKKADELHKKNEEEKAKRLAREQKEREERENKIKKQATLEAELGILKINPYTNEPITDEEDLIIYKLQKEIDDKGGDAINDLPKAIASRERERKAKEKANAEKEDAKAKELEKDIADFHTKYPDVNLQELANDKDYMEFAKDKIGRLTTEEIYLWFTSEKSKVAAKKESDDKKNLVDEASKKLNKTPSANGGGKTTPKSVKDMTDEEFNRYWKENYN